MKYMELLDKLEKLTCRYDLQDIEVTSNKIGSVSVLIFKYRDIVVDCIVLYDDRIKRG